jgi:ADP-dependent NAD(P)H-hydrate dehydratase / NAD(P)H-hydrate epimerase
MSHDHHDLQHSLYATSEIRAIEAAYTKTHAKKSRISLMQKAGAAVAKLAQTLVKKKKGASILVLAGPGNNGGDAWVAAAALKKSGQRITVLALGEHKFADAAAKTAHAAFVRSKGIVSKEFPKDAKFDLIIDGLFGIGLVRAPSGAFANAIARVNSLRAISATPVLAIDIPSGLAADRGVALGEAIVADHTITFLGFKPGLFTSQGKDCAGEVHLEMLGVPAAPSNGSLLLADNVRALIRARKQHSHKGTYGNVAIVGGAEGMVGAAVLAARAALFMGPGKVFLGIAAKDIPAFDPLNPEVMIRKADELIADEDLTAIAIGMGLGTDKSAPRLVAAALARKLPMVLDADALNLMAATPAFANSLTTYRQNSSTGAASRQKTPEKPLQCLSLVLTPHPGEAARLLNVTVAQIEEDRVTSALAVARRFNAVVVLKGAGTIIAHADGRYFINTSGNPGMASGGMGDALSGMIAAFLAQGMDALDAARLAVYLHGAGADACMSHGMAPHGLTASEVIFEARMLLNSGMEHHDH